MIDIVQYCSALPSFLLSILNKAYQIDIRPILPFPLCQKTRTKLCYWDAIEVKRCCDYSRWCEVATVGKKLLLFPEKWMTTLPEYRVIKEHTEACGIIWSIREHTGGYLTIRDHTTSNSHLHIHYLIYNFWHFLIICCINNCWLRMVSSV